jgi:hypothetical protein
LSLWWIRCTFSTMVRKWWVRGNPSLNKFMAIKESIFELIWIKFMLSKNYCFYFLTYGVFILKERENEVFFFCFIENNKWTYTNFSPNSFITFCNFHSSIFFPSKQTHYKLLDHVGRFCCTMSKECMPS